jgi:hypothetical protein
MMRRIPHLYKGRNLIKHAALILMDVCIVLSDNIHSIEANLNWYANGDELKAESKKLLSELEGKTFYSDPQNPSGLVFKIDKGNFVLGRKKHENI